MTADKIKKLIEDKLNRYFSVSFASADKEQVYKAVSLVIRDELLKKKQINKEKINKQELKKAHYLCMEFLVGRLLKNNLYNLGLFEKFRGCLADAGFDIEDILDVEADPGLGNGGLGRLAACYMDCLATKNYPAMGYSLRYEFGLFRQKIVDNMQVELPDLWLDTGETWMMPRQNKTYQVRIGGQVTEDWQSDKLTIRYSGEKLIEAIPYDIIISGADSDGTAVLRLFRAAAFKDFDMNSFSQGDYMSANRADNEAEMITKVLYPPDSHLQGKQLRLTQQYFLVSAALQDILRDHLKHYGDLRNFSEKNAIHINDTHPALAIPELMRLLMDEYGFIWEDAFKITQETMAYTNHTVLSEALETWDAGLFRLQLPRIYMIIEEIDRRYNELRHSDSGLYHNNAVLYNGRVRMANLCVIGSSSVNGVSGLHSDIIKESIFEGFYRVMPEKFTNVTNGIAHRRWLNQSNPRLAELITGLIGDAYYKDASALTALEDYRGDNRVLSELSAIKLDNKKRFADWFKKIAGISVDPYTRLDVQIKRIHEYKRQLMNALRILSLYIDLCDNPDKEVTPQTFIIGGKAAGSYYHAKRVISLIYCLSQEIDRNPKIKSKLNVIFLENYNVTKAEKLIPAAEVSQQISLAGKEASGTSNMKFMINGALTMGTMDGANVEMFERLGDENMFIFGLRANEVEGLRSKGYTGSWIYTSDLKIRRIIEKLRDGVGGEKFADLAAYLTLGTGNIADPYMCLYDFSDYMRAYGEMDKIYSDSHSWNRKTLVNIAQAGYFSADRSIAEYAENIWHIKKIK